jgi:hypothetical protein
MHGAVGLTMQLRYSHLCAGSVAVQFRQGMAIAQWFVTLHCHLTDLSQGTWRVAASNGGYYLLAARGCGLHLAVEWLVAHFMALTRCQWRC